MPNRSSPRGAVQHASGQNKPSKRVQGFFGAGPELRLLLLLLQVTAINSSQQERHCCVHPCSVGVTLRGLLSQVDTLFLPVCLLTYIGCLSLCWPNWLWQALSSDASLLSFRLQQVGAEIHCFSVSEVGIDFRNKFSVTPLLLCICISLEFWPSHWKLWSLFV
jgi:hypothetical protein